MAADLLRQGNLIGLPTETVYGLAANAFDEVALRKIFELKQRPLYNPLIVHTSSLEKAKELVTCFPPQALELAHQCWPGPLTLLLPKSNRIPE